MEVNMVNPVSLTHSQIPEQRLTSVANMSDAPIIQDDSASLEAIKEVSRHRYEKVWSSFKKLSNKGEEFELWKPNEEEVTNYMRHLRTGEGKVHTIF